MAEFTDQFVHIRSNSMPSTSHPTTQRVEEELCRLGTHLPSFGTARLMCDGFRSVGDFYELIEELLHLPRNQQSRQPCQKKWVEEQLDCSLMLLDLIGSVKDCFAAMREHVQDLQSTIRRKGNRSSRATKKAQKLIKECLKVSQHISSKSLRFSGSEEDGYLLLKSLVGARARTISILQSVLSFLLKQKQKARRWSIASKAVSTRRVACEGEWVNTTEEESAGMWLQASYDCIASKHVDVEKMLKAQNHLEALEIRIESLEPGLDRLFKQLIQNRVSLLNLLSS